jgi:hypothetical protein
MSSIDISIKGFFESRFIVGKGDSQVVYAV